MFTLSLCMIVKNENDVIKRCLDCVKNIVDEIIIVDTGSTDNTKEIALKYTDKVYSFKWINDFSAARNFSFSKATKDYIMWLDADDIITPENQKALKQLKKTMNPSVDVVMMKYNVAFDENDNPTFSYYRERILKRTMNFKWVSEIHEVIPTSGYIIHSPIAISHKKIHPNEPQRNLKIFEQILADGKTLDPRQKYYYGRELYYNAKYEQSIAQFLNFLEEGNGWIENNISACRDLAACYYTIGKDTDAINALFKTFLYDTPRAEVCCDIGKHFLDRQQYKIAIFWYETARNQPINQESGAFITLDSYGFIPDIQICLCYDRLGDYKNAFKYNELAGKIKPNDPKYLYNKEYFERMHADVLNFDCKSNS